MDALQEQQMLKKLYPQLSDKEIRAAQLTLELYFALAWEIYEESVLSKRLVDRPKPETHDTQESGDYNLGSRSKFMSQGPRIIPNSGFSLGKVKNV